MRLIDHLKSTGLSNRQARGHLLTGKVWVRGVPTADAGREVIPEEVRIDVNAPKLTPGADLTVLRRDAHLAVVLKPAGLLSVPARNRSGEPTVMSVMARIAGKAMPVHRLDEPTSGLMMVAINEKAQKAIKDQLFHHAIHRGYRAIVERHIPEEPFVVDNHLVRDRGDRKRGSGESPDARPARTDFSLVEHLKGASLVRAVLHTGRTHQVRIHLAELRHPVLGDTVYGNKGVAQKAPRLALHAAELAFDHPVTGEHWSFDIPLPDDMSVLRRSLMLD